MWILESDSACGDSMRELLESFFYEIYIDHIENVVNSSMNEMTNLLKVKYQFGFWKVMIRNDFLIRFTSMFWVSFVRIIEILLIDTDFVWRKI